MHTSHVCLRVLGLLWNLGPLTMPELLAADATHREGTLCGDLLMWLDAGLVERKR